MANPFDTAELRRRVLAAWRDSPSRFRADANVEDDLALTGYRDRVVVELAQNAADAAARAGVPGHLVLTLADGILTAANTGAPLDPAGVESISVARASAKVRSDAEPAADAATVGRFGVGFAAVLSVSDEPSIASTTGAVRWSRRDAVAAVAELPELVGEVEQRGDRVPVLRLPFDDDASPPRGTDTVVTLPLRDTAAVEAVGAQLSAIDGDLLLALPGLEQIEIRRGDEQRRLRVARDGPDVVVHDGAETTRWRVVSARGPLPAELVESQPTELRRFDTWQATWALPADESGRLGPLPETTARVVRAPTPTDDPFTLPAVLIASYPLDAHRRRVTPGPLADVVTAHAADTLATALAELPADPGLLRLVPSGLPDGALDASIHAALTDRLRATAWVPRAADGDDRQRPADAVVVADPLVDVLAQVLPAVAPAGWAGRELVALGARRPSVADLVESLGAVDEPPSWWAALYAALEAAVPAGPERDALGALPVPLSDGRLVTGPRGLVLPAGDEANADLSALGIRVVHPDAVSPLLEQLGAVPATPADVLVLAAVRAAVEASYDAEEPEPIATAVLSLLAAAPGAGAERFPWLAELALPDDVHEWRPAGELALPGGELAGLLAPDAAVGIVSPQWVERWGREPLLAVGVLDGPAVLYDPDAVGPDHDLDDEAAWWSELPDGAVVADFAAVRDLEQVSTAALAQLVELLARPPYRDVLVAPALATLPTGGRLRIRSYTAWWLSSRPVLAGQVPRELCAPEAPALLRALYPAVPAQAAVDREVLECLGVLTDLDDAAPDDVLARLVDVGRGVTRETLRLAYGWLADKDVTPPDRLRAVCGGDVVVADADDCVVVDAPDLRPLVGNRAVLPVPVSHAPSLAHALDIPLASGLADCRVVSIGVAREDAVVHEPLLVEDADGVERQVPWRYAGGVLHVDAGDIAFGLGRGRAWRDRAWEQRHRRTEDLTAAAWGTVRTDEDDLDEPKE